MPKKSGETICKNCSSLGHNYRVCPHPIMSYGIICYYIHEGELYYLMIQRKDSLSFMEFIKGNYDTNDEEYIRQLISNMTEDEKRSLKCFEFEEIWNNAWSNQNPTNTREYEESRYNFNDIHRDGTLNSILNAISKSTSEPEWGFPKGRRKFKETILECSVREFFEETDISPENIRILEDLSIFEEVFFGTNHVLYKHLYYVAEFVGKDMSLKINPEMIEQVKEIRDLKWMRYNEVLEHIKTNYMERINLFKRVHSILIELLNDRIQKCVE